MGVIAKGILRGCQGLFTPVSLGYTLSVFNKNSTLKHTVPIMSPFSSHPHSSRTTSETTPAFSPLAGSLELGSSTPTANKFLFSRGSHDIHSDSVYARAWTPDGMGLSMPTPAGRHRRLTGHEQLSITLSQWDVSSCRPLGFVF